MMNSYSSGVPSVAEWAVLVRVLMKCLKKWVFIWHMKVSVVG